MIEPNHAKRTGCEKQDLTSSDHKQQIRMSYKIGPNDYIFSLAIRACEEEIARDLQRAKS